MSFQQDFASFFFKLISFSFTSCVTIMTRAWRRSACLFGRAGYVLWYPTICTRPPIWPGGYIRETSWLEVLPSDNRKDYKSFFFDLMIIKCCWHHMIWDFKQFDTNRNDIRDTVWYTSKKIDKVRNHVKITAFVVSRVASFLSLTASYLLVCKYSHHAFLSYWRIEAWMLS